MIKIEKFILKNEVECNPLLKIHLKAMKWFGYMIFEYQNFKRLHCFRGVVFTVSFILFNITQVMLITRAYWNRFWKMQGNIFTNFI